MRMRNRFKIQVKTAQKKYFFFNPDHRFSRINEDTFVAKLEHYVDFWPAWNLYFSQAKFHFLVMPVESIVSTVHLNASHASLLDHMLKVGRDTAKEPCNDVTKTTFRFGYHAVPSMRFVPTVLLKQVMKNVAFACNYDDRIMCCLLKFLCRSFSNSLAGLMYLKIFQRTPFPRCGPIIVRSLAKCRSWYFFYGVAYFCPFALLRILNWSCFTIWILKSLN